MSDPRDDHAKSTHPESFMMSHGYRPEWSEGSVKPPLFQTSTFVFKSAEEGKAFFAYAYGLAPLQGPMGLIYSRINNPNLEILESRLNLWDGAEASAVFATGMAAISTAMLAHVPIGHSIVYSRPVYGGTHYLLEKILPEMGIPSRAFPAGADANEVDRLCRELAAAGTPCKMVYLEVPANPTLVLTDIAAMAEAAHRHGALVAVDNTLLGPLYQQPLSLGADLVLYSATKYLGGHSDVVAGVALGSAALIDRVRQFRTILGSILDPHSAWLLLRSLETYKLRMTCARKNAERLVSWLSGHPQVGRVFYPGTIHDRRQRELYDRQCTGAGALISFELKEGGEAEAFRFLNAVQLIKLAVSLGGTESLIEHPATMTHSDIPVAEQMEIGITPQMIRLAVGIEHPDELIADLSRAFEALEAQAIDPKVEKLAEKSARPTAT